MASAPSAATDRHPARVHWALQPQCGICGTHCHEGDRFVARKLLRTPSTGREATLLESTADLQSAAPRTAPRLWAAPRPCASRPRRRPRPTRARTCAGGVAARRAAPARKLCRCTATVWRCIWRATGGRGRARAQPRRRKKSRAGRESRRRAPSQPAPRPCSGSGSRRCGARRGKRRPSSSSSRRTTPCCPGPTPPSTAASACRAWRACRRSWPCSSAERRTTARCGGSTRLRAWRRRWPRRGATVRRPSCRRPLRCSRSTPGSAAGR